MRLTAIPDIKISDCNFVEFEIQNVKDSTQNQNFQCSSHSDLLDIVSIVIGSKRKDLIIRSISSKKVELSFNRKQYNVVFQ